jgi:glycosyltransferase involved in cell wall biosynthesis
MPRVSVIIPTHNRPQMLAAAVDSALAQTFQDFEIIIVLNGASAETVEMASRFAINPKVKIAEMEDSTLAASRNLGLAHAAGEWVAFLDDDDIWLPEKLQVQLDAARETGADLVCCNFCFFNQDGIIEQRALRPRPPGLSFAEALMVGNYVSGGSGVMVKAAKLRDLGGFDASLRGCEDWDMWRRLSWDSAFHLVDRELAKMRRHGTNMTGNLPLAVQAEAQHFAKLLNDTPPKLRHMLPAAEQRFFRFLLHNLTEQGVTDSYGILLYNMAFAAYRLLNKITGGLPRKLYRGIRGAAGQVVRRQGA